MDEEDLVEFMTVFDKKEDGNDKVKGEVQLLTIDLIRKDLGYATSMEEHFLTCISG